MVYTSSASASGAYSSHHMTTQTFEKRKQKVERKNIKKSINQRGIREADALLPLSRRDVRPLLPRICCAVDLQAACLSLPHAVASATDSIEIDPCRNQLNRLLSIVTTNKPPFIPPSFTSSASVRLPGAGTLFYIASLASKGPGDHALLATCNRKNGPDGGGDQKDTQTACPKKGVFCEDQHKVTPLSLCMMMVVSP